MHPAKAFLVTAAILSPMVLVAGCETTAQAVQHKENGLAAAGFVDRPANTPERQAMLARLPPHQFIRRTHGDNVNYVYADPTDCDCLYVGSQAAFARYQQQRQAQNVASENAMAATEFADPAWNWGAWGGFGPGFYWGPGFGW